MFRAWSGSPVVFATDCIKIDLGVEGRGDDGALAGCNQLGLCSGGAPHRPA